MGRGNVCTFGEYEDLFFVDYEKFAIYFEDDDGNPTDQRDYDFEHDMMLEEFEIFKENMENRTSFKKVDNQRSGHDSLIILENDLFSIQLIDNEWSIAVALIQKEEETVTKYAHDKYGSYLRTYYVNLKGFQKKHFQRYLDIMKEELLKQFTEIAIRTSAWTSETIKMEETK